MKTAKRSFKDKFINFIVSVSSTSEFCHGQHVKSYPLCTNQKSKGFNKHHVLGPIIFAFFFSLKI